MLEPSPNIYSWFKKKNNIHELSESMIHIIKYMYLGSLLRNNLWTSTWFFLNCRISRSLATLTYRYCLCGIYILEGRRNKASCWGLPFILTLTCSSLPFVLLSVLTRFWLTALKHPPFIGYVYGWSKSSGLWVSENTLQIFLDLEDTFSCYILRNNWSLRYIDLEVLCVLNARLGKTEVFHKF